MEIENIVANTVYIKARESGGQKKGKSKKWKNYLQFPHYTECLGLKSQIDVGYSYVVEKQPIGRLLFHQYCEASNAQYHKSCIFLSKVEEYETSDDDSGIRRDLASTITAMLSLNRDDTPSSSQNSDTQWCSFLPDEVISRAHAAAEGASHDETPSNDIFAEVSKLVREFLAGDPFKQFTESVYFYRYLQWKWLEKRPVDKHTFRLYRVLGKGGFGEVCACQIRSLECLFFLCASAASAVHRRFDE